MALSMHFNSIYRYTLTMWESHVLYMRACHIVAWNVMWKCNMALNIRYSMLWNGRFYVSRITQYMALLFLADWKPRALRSTKIVNVTSFSNFTCVWDPENSRVSSSLLNEDTPLFVQDPPPVAHLIPFPMSSLSCGFLPIVSLKVCMVHVRY